MDISAIVPCYNEEKSLALFYQEFCRDIARIEGVSYELILVDDGSTDGTLREMKELAAKDSHVRYLSFSRNFGKESAIYAGLENARGDFCVLMDADLQDPPSLLPEMYGYVKDGEYDSVATRRVTRKGEPKIRSFFARQFYKLMSRISKVDLVDGARDYRLMNRKFVNAILSMQEYNRFSKGLFGWVGFRTKWLEYENVERVAGETKWSFFKLFLGVLLTPKAAMTNEQINPVNMFSIIKMKVLFSGVNSNIILLYSLISSLLTPSFSQIGAAALKL